MRGNNVVKRRNIKRQLVPAGYVRNGGQQTEGEAGVASYPSVPRDLHETVGYICFYFIPC